MKFGIVLPNFGNDASRLSIIDTALAAEEMGYDSIWLTDHVALPKADAVRFGHIFECITTLGFLAGVTSKIKIGISSLVLPQRNPVEVAKEIATIDVLSNGRVMLAIGIGWSQGEYSNLNNNFKNRARRMDEAINVLRMLWKSNEPISFTGNFYHFDEVVLLPRPIQPEGPTLWVAGNSAAALNRAARLADGWHPNYKSPEELSVMLAEVKPILRNRPFNVAMRLHIDFKDSPDPNKILSGPPEKIRTQLQEVEQAGADYALLYFDAENQPGRERAMLTFQKEIMDLVRV